jgi:hypothetical protein
MRRPELLAGLLALALGLLHLALAPDSGTDLAAQLAHASFARDHPLTPVDFSWYAGSHPFSYSLLAPWVMGVLGVALTGLLAAVAGSVLLARLVSGSLLAALSGAVFLVGDVVSGRTTFALGAVAGLAAVLALPLRRRVVAFAVLTALLSPVAAAFLGLVAAVLVLHRREGGWTLGLSATVPVVVLAVLFPGGGVQPFTWHSVKPALVVAVLLVVLTGSAVVRTGALLWGFAVLLLFHHHDPFGSNVLRLGLLLAVTVLLATSRRSLVLVLAASLYFVSWQIGPPEGDLRAPAGPSLTAVTAELQRLGARRVEVVAARDHRESSTVAERVPLARGWSRQTDVEQNPLFYKGKLTAAAYLAWLRDRAVDHVAVPVDAVLDMGGKREGALLQHPVDGLTLVWHDRDWRVFEVLAPVPLVSAPATVVASGRTELGFTVDRPATVGVHLRWSRWLSVVSGDACLEQAGDEVRVRVKAPGAVVVGSSLLPHGHC